MKMKALQSFIVFSLVCFAGYAFPAMAGNAYPVMKISSAKAISDTLKPPPIDTVDKNKITDDSLQTEPIVPGGRYGYANKLYLKMIDSLVKVIAEFPVEDSLGLPYAKDWVGTPNMGIRRPNFVVIHHTATNGLREVISEFTKPGGREASSHYVIDKDGTVYHMLNDLLRSHHAGDGKWGNLTDLNSASIGIEIVNNGREPFSLEQINVLVVLLERLKKAYKIPEANFIGHGDVAPTRKVDPSHRFPWKYLNEKGFGLWWSDTTNITVPENFDYLMALRIIGYDVSSPSSAVAAFKRHFMADGSGGSMNAAVRKIIYALYRKYQ